MNILIDIGHPAHIHYFRNAIRLWQRHGHRVLITARDKEVTFSLLRAYGLPYVSRGAGGRGLLGKLLYLLKGDRAIIRAASGFRPDVLLSFGSPYAAQASQWLGKPHIAFDDTEHARLEHAMYLPFTDSVVTPVAFRKNMGNKQIRFQGFIELCHLHPAHFQPDPAVLTMVGLTKGEPFIVLRFVSWGASHDVGQQGISQAQKISLVRDLSRYARIFISSEGPLPGELEPYRLTLPPQRLHDLLACARLYIGEGSTTATECALLGVPNILISSLLKPATCPGVHLELARYGLQSLFTSFDGVLARAVALLGEGVPADYQQRRQVMLADTIDVTAFMVWLVEQYPDSLRILTEQPDFMDRFGAVPVSP